MFSIIHSDESEGAFAGFEGLIIPGLFRNDDDGKDRIVGTQSQVVSANKMLVDLFDRKSSDPPFNLSGDSMMGTKRKIDANSNATMDEPIAKRSNTLDMIDMTGKNTLIATNASSTTSSNAANLYAKLAASLLEDEDMEIEEIVAPSNVAPTPSPIPTVIQQQTIVSSSSSANMPDPKPVITVPMQRQIIMSPNNPTQMILAPSGTNQSMSQPTATIKTDSGYQTVILQQPNQIGNNQMQKQLFQPVIQQQQTQYVLATNQQGQTYLVAQPQPPPVNQILLQTSQQQGGTPTKTIIILQQQSSNNQPNFVNSSGTPQKVIMTTQQGQQMIVTQG